MCIILGVTVNVITAIIVANEFYIIVPKPVNVTLRLHCISLNSSTADGALTAVSINKRQTLAG